MNFGAIDWVIVGALFLIMAWAAIRTKKYSSSVADFLAANRCAGRYVLAVSDGAASIGAISIVAMFEAYYASGYTFIWWALLMNVVLAIIALSGWIQYRFRETRALTMAQFLEMRYSKRFRVFAGLIAFVSGTLNFGIFPGVGAKFFEYYCGFTPYIVNVGPIPVDLTYAAIMIVLIGVALCFTFMGGQITIITTEFIQGTVLNVVMAVILLFLLIKFPWVQVMEAIGARPAGQSMLNPMDSSDTKTFNMWYYLIQAFAAFWCFLAWLGNQGYSSAARNAHEARMGRALGQWRIYTQNIVIIFLPICAFTVINHGDWSATAEKIRGVLNSISTNPDDTMRKQLTTSVALTHFLPAGLIGAFCAVMISAFLSVQQTYMHSWGSIFIQDVLLPLGKKKVNNAKHIGLLRWSIFGVGVFSFLFSLLFSQYDAILMFFALTGLLFLGGGGTVIVLGLYWKRGTTAAAYTAMCVGIAAFIVGFTCQKLWPAYHNGESFPVNSQHLFFFSMVISISLYVAVSLLGKKQVFDLDKMLHRGKWAVKDDQTAVSKEPVSGFAAMFGINRDFSTGDKVIYWFITAWSLLWAVVFVVGTVYAKIFGIPDAVWGKFWHFFTWMVFGIVSFTTIWLTTGGVIDLSKMFKRLASLKRDSADNGEIMDGSEEGREAAKEETAVKP